MRRALAAVVVTGLCLVGAGPAGAAFPGENGRIVYVAGTEPETYGVRTVLPSGHGDQLINREASAYSFSWSPDGRRIAFVGVGGGSDIYTMRADGSDVRRLTVDGHNYSPSYSPGGGRIVFSHNRAVTVMRSDGSERHVIGGQGWAQWTPNGKLVFAKAGPSIWQMNPDGTHQHRLVGGYGPIYSPDGSTFLFLRSAEDRLARVVGDHLHVLLADADGDNIREPPCRGAFSHVYTDPTRSGPLPITYSPDGRWLLVTTGYDVSAQNLVRLSLGSCTRSTVARGTYGVADWQALPLTR